MRRIAILAIAMLASAVATHAQEVMKLASDRMLTVADITTDAPRKKCNSKFGMELQQYLRSGKLKSQQKKAGANGVKTVPSVSVMVMLVPSAGITAEVLENAGCKVNWSMKSQAFVTVPVDKLEDLAAINGVLGINLPEMEKLHNEAAREDTKVSLVADPVSAEAAGLPQAYDGSGVIVGVVDTGIDFAHPAFRNEDGTTRIKRAFTYRRTDMIQPGEPESSWKNIYTDPAEILNVTPVTADTHGSHTMGTAAGSNTGNNLQGMAPGAELVPADLNVLARNYLVSGLMSICEYAEEVSKPVVINYSIGSPGVFRDGCHPVAQAMKELNEDGTKPGVIFSVSAGNEGYYNNYVHHKFTSKDEKIYVMMDMPSKVKEIQTAGGMVRVLPLDGEEQLTGLANKDVDFIGETPIAYSLSEQRILGDDELIGYAVMYGGEMEDGGYGYSFLPFEDCDSLGVYKISINILRGMLSAEGYYGEFNHNCFDGVTKKRCISYLVSKEMEIFLLEDTRLGGCFSLPAGTELTVMYENNRAGNLIKPEGFDFVRRGTSDGSINETVCNSASIAVGAYTVRNEFTSYFDDEFKSRYDIGEITNFTSYGYVNDGSNVAKPDVVAPGSYLLSAVNGNYAPYFETYGNPLPIDKIESSKYLAQMVEYDGKNYWYEYMQGTSMAAPVVTGIIALWLQADPTLSVENVREIIAKTSDYDEACAADPRRAGHGKINALRGLEYILASSGINDVCKDKDSDTVKFLDKDNRLVIRRGNHLYDATGRMIKD